LLENAAESLAKTLKHSLGENVLGPEPPIIPRIQGLHITEILVKIKRDGTIPRIKDFIGHSILMLRQNKKTAPILVSVDVDPY